MDNLINRNVLIQPKWQVVRFPVEHISMMTWSNLDRRYGANSNGKYPTRQLQRWSAELVSAEFWISCYGKGYVRGVCDGTGTYNYLYFQYDYYNYYIRWSTTTTLQPVHQASTTSLLLLLVRLLLQQRILRNRIVNKSEWLVDWSTFCTIRMVYLPADYSL